MVKLGPRVLNWLFLIVIFAVVIEIIGFGYYSSRHLPATVTTPAK